MATLEVNMINDKAYKEFVDSLVRNEEAIRIGIAITLAQNLKANNLNLSQVIKKVGFNYYRK